MYDPEFTPQAEARDDAEPYNETAGPDGWPAWVPGERRRELLRAKANRLARPPAVEDELGDDDETRDNMIRLEVRDRFNRVIDTLAIPRP